MSSAFVRGIMRAAPIAAGYVPVAITFGIIARSGGLSAIETIATSLVVFAGAAQFMAVAMLNAGALQIVAATFFLNFRHLIMSSVVALRLRPDRSGGRLRDVAARTVLAFGITDEVFAVAAHDSTVNRAELAGTELGAYSAWVGGTVIGVLVGGVIPPRLQAALGVALYALFAAILTTHVRRHPGLLGAAAAAGGLNMLLRSGLGWSTGVAFPVAMLGGAALAMMVIPARWMPTGEVQ